MPSDLQRLEHPFVEEGVGVGEAHALHEVGRNVERVGDDGALLHHHRAAAGDAAHDVVAVLRRRRRGRPRSSATGSCRSRRPTRSTPRCAASACGARRRPPRRAPRRGPGASAARRPASARSPSRSRSSSSPSTASGGWRRRPPPGRSRAGWRPRAAPARTAAAMLAASLSAGRPFTRGVDVLERLVGLEEEVAGEPEVRDLRRRPPRDRRRRACRLEPYIHRACSKPNRRCAAAAMIESRRSVSTCSG